MNTRLPEMEPARKPAWIHPHDWSGIECARCGMRAHWAGAKAPCAGYSKHRRSREKKRLLREQRRQSA